MIEMLLQAERAMALGLIDQAEATYRQLVETDPRNAVAVVGLARVALERRQDRLAYDLAVRALEIDPQDAAALRMEARLSEVLVTRGEVVQRPGFVVPSTPRPPVPSAPPRPVPSTLPPAPPRSTSQPTPQPAPPRSASQPTPQPASPESPPPGSAPLSKPTPAGSTPPGSTPPTEPAPPRSAPPRRPGLLDRLRRRR